MDGWELVWEMMDLFQTDVSSRRGQSPLPSVLLFFAFLDDNSLFRTSHQNDNPNEQR